VEWKDSVGLEEQKSCSDNQILLSNRTSAFRAENFFAIQFKRPPFCVCAPDSERYGAFIREHIESVNIIFRHFMRLCPLMNGKKRENLLLLFLSGFCSIDMMLCARF
jgi:hypothetical protein